MKNLLTFMSPTKGMDLYHTKLLKIQIENSLEYWNPGDILFVANFPFEHMGIKSVEIPDLINSQYPENTRAIINSKINIFIYLLENKILNELAWYHDFDAFQVAPLVLPPIPKDLGCVCYGHYPPWIMSYWGKSTGKLGKELKKTEWGYDRRINFGNVFIKPESLDILKMLLEKMDSEGLYEEDAMTLMLDEIPEIEERVQIMNQTYNMGIRCVKDNMRLIDKPLRVVHFPPIHKRWKEKFLPYLPDKLKQRINEEFTDICEP